MKKTFLLLMCLSLLLYGCIFEISNDDNSQDEILQITNVIEGIFNAYNSQNVDAIMSFYDGDFLHNNNNYYNERDIWEDRLDDPDMKYAYVSNINVTINGNYAYVTFSLSIGSIYVPSYEYDDVAYLRKRSGFWKVYGNQNYVEDYYSLTVETEPSGANIYLNGQNIYHTTPYIIDYISEGTYTIGVYLMSYNEETRTVYVDEDITVSIDLEWPVNPPIINIYYPENGQTINGDEFKLQGYIPFFYGDKATLNLNGDEQVIEVYCGDFNQWISITEQENEFYLRATNSQGNTGVSDIYTIYRYEQIDELRIELTWNTDSTDVDLHIWDPDENHCYFGDKFAIPNGYLEQDITDGYGPEIFYQSQISSGIYVVKAHFYEGYSYINPTLAEVEIIFNEETTYFGPYEFTADGEDEGAWWDVTSFTIISGKLSKSKDTIININKIITKKDSK
ncbi:MAG: PEGA domain-containing protein [Candidatus Cloacimonetes bacterium]|nr:PEGA domain-containing protein [Candidatus Cloacimonadota bacterium]